MERTGDGALVLDLVIGALDLLDPIPQVGGHGGRAAPFVPGLQHHVQHPQRHREKELLLRLRQ